MQGFDSMGAVFFLSLFFILSVSLLFLLGMFKIKKGWFFYLIKQYQLNIILRY